MQKSNAIRILEKANISFDILTYDVDETDLSGTSTAKKLHISCEQMFKTLVVKNEKKQIFVCCIPVAEELDLKKAAKHLGSKSIEMLSVKELLPMVGYVRGSCSPIGMKKHFPTFIDETCVLFEDMYISGGMKGLTLKISVEDLIKFVDATCVELCKG